MGGSQSREQLEAAKAQLAAAEKRNSALDAERQALEGRLSAQAAELASARETMAEAGRACAEQLERKDAEVAGAVKKRELAEQLRRNDALLAKRLMHAQLVHLGGKAPGGVGGAGGAGVEEGALAASLALAAQDELQLREMLMRCANELEATQRTAEQLMRAATAQRRAELARELWLPEMCDVSATVGRGPLLARVGVKMPRASQPGVRGTGLSPGLGLMRMLGQPGSDAQWAAVGGALLWDASEREVSAMRLALSAQPAPHQHVTLSMDHTGGLTGSVKTTREALTARLFGTFDLNRKSPIRAGLEVAVDLDP